MSEQINTIKEEVREEASPDEVTPCQQLSHSDHLKKHASFGSVLFLGFTSLGSIYGDIGTSPLYTVPSIFNANDLDPTEKNICGVVSCIFWVFTIIVILKYCAFVLTFGPNNGEGGQIALYCKIARSLNNSATSELQEHNKAQNDDMPLLSRLETTNSQTTSFFQHDASWMSNKSFRKWMGHVTLALCFVGCAMVISDGLLTPTTSVLSAMEGITVPVPSFANKTMPVSVVVLVLLFLIQPLGTAKISLFFSPILTVWFLALLVIGIINISSTPRIFKTLNPAEAIYLLKRQGNINILGDTMLAITGVEAMFADVGHFSPLSVQLTLLLFVYPSLMVTYLGQGAYLIKNPTQVSNVFFQSIPGKNGQGIYWFIFVLSILATIIASQALILGVSSICKQLIAVGFLPSFKVVHKSASHGGRIFIPVINFMLMVGVLICCVCFRTSARVTAAYGLTVSIDLFITTLFMTVVLLCVLKTYVVFAVLFLCVFASLECCLVGANLLKVPHGAWVPLMVTAVLVTFLVLWNWCHNLKTTEEIANRVTVNRLLQDCQQSLSDGSTGNHSRPADEAKAHNDIRFQQNLTDTIPIPRSNRVGIMYTNLFIMLKHPNSVPRLFKDLTNSFLTIPRVFAFVGIEISNVPYVDDHERILIQRMHYDGLYRCVIRVGFMEGDGKDDKKTEQLLRALSDEVGMDLSAIPVVQIANADQIVGRQKPLANPFVRASYKVRKLIIEYFYAPLEYATERGSNDEQRTVFFGKTVAL
ncbi:unnamed protein product [Kluyveromyces dobzhanskii CBS 2104]|uniref:WGS project CCBQ000000000 data, contig 00272 n=1 Tax=Kluyveromyces dobzhanskii CBS 2104 TaxID=1427455 RepID=A0A0A8L8K1_9SACH|nr:unnamed protein product [Kluyveromyces dobzhanskii CBS 2104]